MVNRVGVVVVTYNRKEMLGKTLDHILSQKFGPEFIILIDNKSTDGTDDLIEKYFKIEKIKYFQMSENIGGSAAFSLGIRKAYESGCDAIWIMDDDCQPEQEALGYLIDDILEGGYDFAASKVLWSDGQPHKMNIPSLQSDGKIIKSSSFVSLLITRKCVSVAGLPIRDFFIWGDDLEYTQRLVKMGLRGIFSEKSVVFHMTQSNYSFSILDIDQKSHKKYYHGLRNVIYISKKKGVKSLLFMIARYLLAILNKPSIYKTKMLLSGIFRGIMFEPTVEKV